jgi:hypothetical protein
MRIGREGDGGRSHACMRAQQSTLVLERSSVLRVHAWLMSSSCSASIPSLPMSAAHMCRAVTRP